MRLFVSIQLNQEMLDALTELQGTLQLRGMRGRFAPEENLHLTLAFIGEYTDADRVLEALRSVEFEPFSIELDGAGCFADLWWAGICKSEALGSLARKVRRALAEAEIPFDRKRFVPHITLVRRASWSDGALEDLPVPQVGMLVERVSLMRSDRGKRGMVYTEIGM